MTPEQALQILSQATSQLNTSRAAHLQIMQALEVLQKLIPKLKPNVKTADTKEKENGK